MSAKQKALEKQAQNEAARKKKADEDAERAEAANWSVGARDSSRQKAEEDKDHKTNKFSNENNKTEKEEER